MNNTSLKQIAAMVQVLIAKQQQQEKINANRIHK
jgi:hypothetical protein